MTINSQISGTGVALTKSGAGMLYLTNANNSGAGGYTGSTYLNQGVLSVNSAAAAPGTGSLQFSGGTLQLTAPANITQSIVLNGGGGSTIDTQGNAVTISNVISGSGGLTKMGSGTLTLSNSNTYQGTTTINGGMLVGTAGQSSFGTGASNFTGAVNISAGTLQLLPGSGGTTSIGVLTTNGAATVQIAATNSSAAATLSMLSIASATNTTLVLDTGLGTLNGNAVFQTTAPLAVVNGIVNAQVVVNQNGTGDFLTQTPTSGTGPFNLVTATYTGTSLTSATASSQATAACCHQSNVVRQSHGQHVCLRFADQRCQHHRPGRKHSYPGRRGQPGRLDLQRGHQQQQLDPERNAGIWRQHRGHLCQPGLQCGHQRRHHGDRWSDPLRVRHSHPEWC